MKIRKNYVSNSSSSSFLAIGYVLEDEDNSRYFDIIKNIAPELAKEYDNIEKLLDNRGKEVFWSGIEVRCGNYDNGFANGKTFVGKIVDTMSDEFDCFSYKTYEITDIQKELSVIEKNLNANELQLKVIVGNQYL